VLACLLLLPALGALANQVPAGGSGSFPPTSSNAVYFAWAVYDPSHTLIALSGAPVSGPNGWNVSFSTGFNGTSSYITSITVTAPSTAGIGAGYSVTVAGPPGNNTASFDVTGSAPSPYVVNGLTISPGSVYSGDTATGTVSIASIAPSGGVAVSLTSTSSSNPYNYALVSPTVWISAGRSIGVFSIVTAGTTSATITASNGGQSRSGYIGVSSSPAVGGAVSRSHSGSFAPVASRGNAAYWAVYGPTGTIVASSGGSVPTNGWSVSFGTYYNGQTTVISSISVTPPATAMVANNYTVAVAGPPGNNVAYFNVTY